MCNIGRIRQIITNEAKPMTAFEIIVTAIPIKIRELVYVRRIHPTKPKELSNVNRVQGMEDTEYKR